MILEAIVTTQNDDGSTNIAPMGPCCDDPSLNQFELRPFTSSSTFNNLKNRKQGVLHITDDVLLFAKAAVHALDIAPPVEPATMVDVSMLSDSCRRLEFEVTWISPVQPRSSMQCQTLCQHHVRSFLGFNRAKHAVIEACILATRIDFIPLEEIKHKFSEHSLTVQKTGGEQEKMAMEVLQRFVDQFTTEQSAGNRASS